MAIALITVVSIGALAIGSGLLRLQPAPTSPVVAPPSAQPIPTAQTPAAAIWTAAGAMLGRRQSHTATLLHDGQVLIAGGTNGSKGLATAELYDPATGTWTATGHMIHARQRQTATLLLDGRVLVTGGVTTDGDMASAELYQPASGTWRAVGAMHDARIEGTATLLTDGRVLVAGGIGADGSFLRSAELYDPATERWTVTGSLSAGRFGHTATLLPDGKVLIVGGTRALAGDPQHADVSSSAEVFDPIAGTWSPTGSMATGRRNHSATLLPNGTVLVVGGVSPGGVTHPDGTGGAHGLASAEIYDPSSESWTTTGSLTDARAAQTATLLLDGRVLVAGGTSGVEDLASAELFDSTSGSWTAGGDLQTPRRGETATLLEDGRVLVAGGSKLLGIVDGNAVLQVEASAELFDPGDR
ncbi:MAG TPA: kelch repeat-containing protein [Candidatus Limnocylindrales bacterium]